MKNEYAAQVLGRLQQLVNDDAAWRWAQATGHPCDPAKPEQLRAAFLARPYEERRQYYVRPNRALLGAARSPSSAEERAAIKAYRKSGDAEYAMRVAGTPLGVEATPRKRNSEGLAEVLESELRAPEAEDGAPRETALEDAANRAAESGYYDVLGWADRTPGPEEATELSLCDALLEEARAQVPPRDWAVYLALYVDGRSRREVAGEFDLSYRQVWSIEDNVTATLRAIVEARGVKI